MPKGWQLRNTIWFALNVYFVSNTERLDSSDPNLQPLNYLTPAPYAFAIWAVIYSLEFLFIVWQFFHTRPFLLIRFSAYFCGANASQVLWCLAFRSSFDTPALLWISAVFLSGIAAFLSGAHKQICDEAETEEGLIFQEWFFAYVPITIHFGWTTAAALVNWNGYIARCGLPPTLKLACLLVSLGLATIVAIRVTLRRSSTVYALTVAWAVMAVSVQTSKSVAFAEEIPGGKDTASALAGLEFVLGLAIFGTGVTIAIPKDMEAESRPQLRHARLSWSAADDAEVTSMPSTRSRLGRRMSFWRKGSRLGM